MPWPLPVVDSVDLAFWTGGADGRLQIQRCRTCRRWQHPPTPLCTVCLTNTVSPTAASGRARVLTWSTNVQPWTSDLPVPYTVAVVELEEQQGLRLITRLVDVADPRVGQQVAVFFEQSGDVWLPLFRPA